jgi:hypothetical protein
MYKLTITECTDRIKLMRALRAFNPSFSLRDIKRIVDAICDGKWFVVDNRLESPSEIEQFFGGSSVWLYDKIPRTIDEFDQEDQLYTMARLWYNSLPKEDQQEIDILIRHSAPHA